jgi:GTP cyclohydrolase IV
VNRHAPLGAAGVALSRAGVIGVEAVVRLGADERSAQPFAARIDCVVEPAGTRPQADAPRVEEVVTGVIRDVVSATAGVRAERLAQEIAERVRERAGARRAEAVIAARFPERRPAPVSAIATQEISTLHARAVASARGTRWIAGVSAQGMTAAPGAQAVVVAESRERLAAGGFSGDRAERVLEHVPVATHDQRGVGTLLLGCPAGCALEVDVAALLDIVEGAMSSEIYELMKRSDEAAVVERAHRRPRAVDDCVRAMIAGVVESFPHFPDAAFVSAEQDSTETIRGHHLSAERAGLLGELRRELLTRGPAARRTPMRAWLDADGG